MGFCHYAHAATCCASERSGELALRTRVKVNLRLLQENELPRLGRAKGDEHGQDLTRSKPDIRNIDEILRASAANMRKPPYLQFNPRVIELSRHDLPGKS